VSRHAYTVESSPARVEREGGTRVDVTAEQMPILSGLALATLRLDPGAAREPHWHPNAAELSYCLEGSARMTIVESGGTAVTMTVEAGDLVFVPAGLAHDIEASPDGPTRFLVCFGNERYEDLSLTQVAAEMPAHVLAATFGVPASEFGWVEPVAEPAFIARPHEPATGPAATSPYRLQLERMEPDVVNDGGSLIFGRADDLPVLDGLAMYSLRMTGSAVREPHWHPNAAELNYVIEGSVRLTIVSPGGDVETVDLEAGDISFIPRAYFHHIEATGEGAARLAVFFDHEMPADNGVAAALGAYPPALLDAAFGRPAGSFAALPRFDADVLMSPPAPGGDG
jgi:oxalate decarboxylase